MIRSTTIAATFSFSEFSPWSMEFPLLQQSGCFNNDEGLLDILWII